MNGLLFLGTCGAAALARTPKRFHPGVNIIEDTLASAKVMNHVESLGTAPVCGPADLALRAVEDGAFPLSGSQENTVMVRHGGIVELTTYTGNRLAQA